MKMMYVTIPLLIALGLIIYFANYRHAVIDSASILIKEKSDGIPPYSHQKLIDLLFAEQTIKEINQLSSTKETEPNTVWGKFYEVEKLLEQTKRNEAKEILKEIANDKNSESRAILWAWNELRVLGETTSSPKVLGIILEVPMQDSTEYLAMYSDLTVRYFNYTGSIAIWEAHGRNMDTLIQNIILQSQNFVDSKKLGKGRNKLSTNNIRFNFLTTAGIFQTEKTFEELSGNKSDIQQIFMKSSQALQLILKEGSKK